MSETVFISYAHSDAVDFTKKLADSLTDRGCKVFVDERSIPPGAPFIREIERSILNSTHFIAILTPGYRDSEWCMPEWEIARRHNKHIIPVLYIELETDFPGFIGNIQFIDFQNSLADSYKFVSQLERLNNVIQPLPNWLDTPVKRFAVHTSTHEVRCITKSTPLKEALSIMNDADFSFRHFLVTNDGKAGGKLQGIIGYRNILRKEKDSTDIFHKLHVKDAMRPFDPSQFAQPTFAYLRENDTLKTALQKFTRRLTKEVGIQHNFFYMSTIPIVDEQDRATGVISFKDVMGAMIRGEIPIPNTTVGAIMRRGENICVSAPSETIVDAKYKLLQLGQRDVVVVDYEKDRTFYGMVPDSELIVNLHPKKSTEETPQPYKRVDEIMVPYPDFEEATFCMTGEITVAEMLSKYILTRYSKTFYDFPVVSYKLTNKLNRKPQFEGLVGYRDVFRKLVDSQEEIVYYQKVAPIIGETTQH